MYIHTDTYDHYIRSIYTLNPYRNTTYTYTYRHTLIILKHYSHPLYTLFYTPLHTNINTHLSINTHIHSHVHTKYTN